MYDFLSLRNFLLALSSLIGVVLFAATFFKLVQESSSTGARKYTSFQLGLMFAVSIIMISCVTYMNMGSYTVFGSNSFTVSASDPWLVGTNIQSILMQLKITSEDAGKFAHVVTLFFMSMKSLGLALFIVSLIKWYQLADGNSSVSTGRLILSFILAIVFWNFGLVIQMVSRWLGYDIQI